MAEPSIIYNRKKELTLEETIRQCTAFRDLAPKIKGAVLIDVDRPIDDIVNEIVSLIVHQRVELTCPKLLYHD